MTPFQEAMIIVATVLLTAYFISLLLPAARTSKSSAALNESAAAGSHRDQRLGRQDYYRPSYHDSKKIYVNRGRTLTLHYVTWCKYCTMFFTEWDRAKILAARTPAEYTHSQRNAYIGPVVFREICEDTGKSPGIAGYPTIILTTETGRAHRYDGPRDAAHLVAWSRQMR